MKLFLSLLSLITATAPLLAEGGGAPSQQQGMVQILVTIVIAVLFFYIILWRPEQKRRKALEEQRSSLKKGDKVTAMGIIGTVDTIDAHTVILTMVDGGKIEVLTAAITDVASPESGASG